MLFLIILHYKLVKRANFLQGLSVLGEALTEWNRLVSIDHLSVSLSPDKQTNSMISVSVEILRWIFFLQKEMISLWHRSAENIGAFFDEEICKSFVKYCNGHKRWPNLPTAILINSDYFQLSSEFFQHSC